MSHLMSDTSETNPTALPQVQVGIVTYNSRDDLPGCFAALARQTYPQIAVTVWDNASSDGSADWAAAHAPDADVIHSAENVGYGRGHNAIAARQPDAYYLALNPDARLEPEYIAALVHALEGDPRAGWATGKLLLPVSEDGGEDDVQAGESPRTIYSIGHGMLRDGYAFNIGYGEADDARFASGREVFGAPGAAVLIKPALVADLGMLFEPRFFLYNEDTDLDWRAQRAGWTCLYVPDAVATHRGSHPREALRVEALTNRSLSVLRNAYWRDLLIVNLPRIVLHTAVRCVITPRLGLRMARRLLLLGPVMIRLRRKPRRTYAGMQHWFAWSAQQPGGEAGALSARIRALRDALRRRRADAADANLNVTKALPLA